MALLEEQQHGDDVCCRTSKEPATGSRNAVEFEQEARPNEGHDEADGGASRVGIIRHRTTVHTGGLLVEVTPNHKN